MASARALFVVLLVGCLVVVGFAHTDSAGHDSICSPEKGDSCVETVAGHDRSALSRLIQSASPDALHKFLHTVTGFQHGVFDSDEAAVEAVLELDPTLSSTVAQLQRRQDNGTTTDQTSPPAGNTETTSSTPTTTSQSSPPVDTPSTTTTTTLPPSSTAETTTTETSPNPPTTTSDTSTTPTETPSSTQQTSTEQTTTTRPTATTTTANGMTTSTRPTSSPKTNVLTTTLPGGAVTTQTSVVWVTPGVEEDPTTTNTADASLQSGMAAAGLRRPLLEVFIGGAAALAVLA